MPDLTDLQALKVVHEMARLYHEEEALVLKSLLHDGYDPQDAADHQASSLSLIEQMIERVEASTRYDRVAMAEDVLYDCGYCAPLYLTADRLRQKLGPKAHGMTDREVLVQADNLLASQALTTKKDMIEHLEALVWEAWQDPLPSNPAEKTEP